MKTMKWVLVAFASLFITTTAQAGEICHDIYSPTEEAVVIVASTASRAPGAFNNAFHLHNNKPTWVYDLGHKLWHTKLCLKKTVWEDWGVRFKQSGLSLCLRQPGVRVDCKTFTDKLFTEFVCEPTRYVFNVNR